ncbi:MAG: outer membrane beta-barrel protein, partial [Longimicrobiales bacterium]
MLLVTGMAWSQDESDASGMRLAPGVRLEPAIGTRLSFTDNAYRTDAEKTDAAGLVVDPSLVLAYSPSHGKYRLGYEGQVGAFDTSDQDNYTDSQFYLTGMLTPLLRHRVDFDLRYKDGHDPFGTNRTQGQPAIRDRELDRWNETGVAGKYTFGHGEATLNLYGRAGLLDKEYKTNREDSFGAGSGTRYLDYGSTLIGGGVIYRLTAKTRLVLDLEQQDIDYDLEFPTGSFDGDSQRALLGARWIATAKTSGEFLLGYYARNFDDNGRTDVSGVDWQVRVDWAARPRSLFSLTSG